MKGKINWITSAIGVHAWTLKLRVESKSGDEQTKRTNKCA